MQGKLVEQDPNDESVEVLLEKIRAENKNSLKKARLKRKIWTFLLFPKEMIALIMGTKTKQPLILYMKSQKHGDILNLLA
ncbi:restriction endonuclease S subunit [Streptococcus pneumoniae GA47439]|nr:restriction endonuclease S subunit [Streptococcus pneumoniae GA47439]